MNYQNYQNSLQDMTLPLAYVNLDYLEQNARQILERAGDMPVRVVSKSLRSVDIIKRILAYSPRFQGVMCFHPDEAAFLAEQGLDDLLVAYPSMQAKSIEAACRSALKGTRIVLMVDSVAHVELIDRVAKQVGVVMPVCMDIDMSTGFPGIYFGVRRSPISTPDQAVKLYRAIAQKAAVRLESVMGYEAQIAGIGENIPGKTLQNQAIPWLKRLSIPLISRRRIAIVNALKKAGATLRFVNGGGTGSIESTQQDTSVTELAVGSGFFSPHLFDYYHDFCFLPAAGFALEVSRLPGHGYVTCGGGGYIASGGVGLEKAPKPYLPEGLMLDDNEGAGEVQTPLKSVADKKYKSVVQSLAPGDPVLFRHCKAGELCERFNELVLIKNGEVVDTCLTYRGHGKTFI